MRKVEMKRIITIALIALSMIGLFAANQASLLARPSPMAEEAMATANQLYEMGHFAQAAQAYQQLADQGIADTALLYNLGNAYFRQENPAGFRRQGKPGAGARQDRG
jgi:hypothetical protein